jgi:hypothetical protein
MTRSGQENAKEQNDEKNQTQIEVVPWEDQERQKKKEITQNKKIPSQSPSKEI